MSFNNSELTKRTSDIIELAPLGSSLPLAPETQWNLRLRYDKTFNTVPMYFQFSTTCFESYSSLVLARRYKQEAYNILNFSIGVDFEDWAIELFARNLDDERAELYYNEMDETPRMHTIRPQNIGLRFKYTLDSLKREYLIGKLNYLLQYSSAGRARPCQGRGHGFEPRYSLHYNKLSAISWFLSR